MFWKYNKFVNYIVIGENVKNDNQCTKCGHVCESENALITHIIGFHAEMKNLQPCCSLQNSKEEFMLHIMGHADANDHAIKPQSQQKFTWWIIF